MDDTSSLPNPTTPSPAPSSVQEQLEAIGNIVTILLATVICISGSISVFLYRQATVLSRQVSEGRRIALEFETNSLPRINMFVSSLQTFSKSNPDFAAVLAKYPIQPATAPTGTATPSAPVPAPKPAAAPKK